MHDGRTQARDGTGPRCRAGDWGYRALLRLNRLYNQWRAWRGKEYWSLSKAIKARVNEAVNHVSKFETHIARLARERDCVGVMCGHIHSAADKWIGDVHYLNSGDWVESLTAIVEHWDGRYELVNFADFVRQHPLPVDRDEEDLTALNRSAADVPGRPDTESFEVSELARPG